MKYSILRNKKILEANNDKPHDMDTNLVFANNQAAINAIRKTGAKQMFVIPKMRARVAD